MALANGKKLGPYEVLAPLGAGGMGEVYRARDTRLGREVAIKVLPSHLSSNPDLKTRFEREAKAISGLNHPHICTLHDVGHQDGVDFLVMELLEGESLDKRLERGPLPLKQALEVGVEIAEALEKAHKSGIVHRDLKPGNIVLTKAGAKLLDFGLAKPPSSQLANFSSDSPTVPTLSKPLTAEGTIIGTYQYMAPEQLEGKDADAQSDIFSFGAVLYEMVTGKRAFTGKSAISVMSAIAEKEPQSITALQPMTPPAMEHVICTCLAKERERRYQSVLDVKLELEWINAARQPAVMGAPSGKDRRKWQAWTLSVAVVVAALIVAATYYATRPAVEAPLMVSLMPPSGVFPDTLGRNGPPEISPDGSRLAFVGCKTESASRSITTSKLCSIWLRSLHTTEAHEVAGTNGGYSPFWSPDGREIGFFADGKLLRVAADGGPVQVICDAEDARGGSWGSSGTIIFAATRSSPIFRVPAEGGTPVAVTHSAPVSNLSQVGSHRWPHLLPDGEHFLYVNGPVGSCSDRNEMHFASLDGKQDVALISTCSSPDFAAGRLIYWQDGNLMAQSFDARRGVLSGAAMPIVSHVALDSSFSFGEFSASADGKLVYLTGEGITGAQLVWYDRSGKVLGTLGESALYASVAISPDGSRVAADTLSLKESNIRVMDARGTRTLTTFGSGSSYFPVWSADGKQVYFTSNVNGPYDIFAKAADGSGDEQPVVRFEKRQFGAALLAASPDGKFLAYVTSDPTTNLDIYIIPLTGDRKPRPFLHSAANESAPAFSPDGKWLAYESTHSGRNEVYITPFPAGGAQYQVSTAGGERPVWRRDGKEIFYRQNLELMAVEVTAKNGVIELGAAKSLFEVAVRNLSGRWLDVSPDGRFLMNTTPTAAQAQNFEIVVNWPAVLKK